MDEAERRSGNDRRAGWRGRSVIDPLSAIVEGVTDYAIFMLDRDGYVMTWNPGAERIKGYSHGRRRPPLLGVLSAGGRRRRQARRRS